MNQGPKFGYNREWADIQKAIFGEKEPTLEERNLLKIQLYNRGALDSLKRILKIWLPKGEKPSAKFHLF